MNGDLLPALHLWKDNTGFDYSTLVLQRKHLAYRQIGKLVPFLLGNGLAPAMMTEFMEARGLLDNDTDRGTVNYWIKKFNRGDRSAFYFDMGQEKWMYADGTERSV